MQGSASRYLILAGILVAGAGLLALLAKPPSVAAGRWPTEENLFIVGGWRPGPASLQRDHGVNFISRGYSRADGAEALLMVSTSPVAKNIYRAGADVPFLGSGYTVDPAPPSLVPGDPKRGALIVRRGNAASLLLYAYGERRGLIGNGLTAWAFVTLDSVVGQPNDYFLASVLAPLDSASASDTVALADALFPRLAAWYAA